MLHNLSLLHNLRVSGNKTVHGWAWPRNLNEPAGSFRGGGLCRCARTALTVVVLSCRIESYSCKMAGDDKHMFKQFCQEGEPHVLEALSPPQSSSGASPSLSVMPGWSIPSTNTKDNVQFPLLLFQAGKEQRGRGEPPERQVLQEDSVLPHHNT